MPVAECAGALASRLDTRAAVQKKIRVAARQQSAPEPFRNRTAQGLLVVCVKLFLLLRLLGQFYFCAFQLLGHSRNVLLVNVCRH
jgi:hypothetical protein